MIREAFGIGEASHGNITYQDLLRMPVDRYMYTIDESNLILKENRKATNSLLDGL